MVRAAVAPAVRRFENAFRLRDDLPDAFLVGHVPALRSHYGDGGGNEAVPVVGRAGIAAPEVILRALAPIDEVLLLPAGVVGQPTVQFRQELVLGGEELKLFSDLLKDLLR